MHKEFIKIQHELNNNVYMIIDTETTGLAKTDRIVEITWRVCINQGEIYNRSFLIKPDGFIIPHQVIEIHHITTEYATKHGIPIDAMFKVFNKDLNDVTHIVAHNASFDMGMITSELVRLGKQDIVDKLNSKKIICTKLSTKDICNLKDKNGHLKMPKQCELYKYVFNKEMGNAHRSGDDTRNLRDIFLELLKRDMISP